MTTAQKILILTQHGIETRCYNGIFQAKNEYTYNGNYYFDWLAIKQINVYTWLGY